MTLLEWNNWMTEIEMNRHAIREKALQALYPLAFQKELTPSAAIQQIFALASDQHAELEEMIEPPDYLITLVAGVQAKQAELDAVIQKYLRNWKLNRLASIDLFILRIAVYEMLYVPAVPGKVALNEALELAKKYSDEKSRKFVNGILSNVLADLPTE